METNEDKLNRLINAAMEVAEESDTDPEIFLGAFMGGVVLGHILTDTNLDFLEYIMTTEPGRRTFAKSMSVAINLNSR